MASDFTSPRKKKGKRGKERKWEDKTSPKAGRKAERQAGRPKDEQTERQMDRRFVGLSILLDSKLGVDPLVSAPGPLGPSGPSN